MDIRVERLNKAFTASGLSQTELCERTGLTKGAISSYLSGRYIPKQRATEALSNALNVSVNYLMGYGEEMKDENEISVDLTIDESILIEKIRKMSPATKKMLLSIADTLLRGDESHVD